MTLSILLHGVSGKLLMAVRMPRRTGGHAMALEPESRHWAVRERV